MCLGKQNIIEDMKRVMLGTNNTMHSVKINTDSLSEPIHSMTGCL